MLEEITKMMDMDDVVKEATGGSVAGSTSGKHTSGKKSKKQSVQRVVREEINEMSDAEAGLLLEDLDLDVIPEKDE